MEVNETDPGLVKEYKERVYAYKVYYLKYQFPAIIYFFHKKKILLNRNWNEIMACPIHN